MKSGAGQAKCSVALTELLGHNGGPDFGIEQLYQLVGPKRPERPSAFQCGAPWTAHASDKELKRLGKIQGRIDRRERAIKEIRKERTKIMMRCIRRMRRAEGAD